MKADKALEQNISKEILELLPDAVLLVDSEGVISLVNDQATEMFGYDKEELLSMRIDMLVPERYRYHHSSYRKSYGENPTRKLMSKREELYARRKDGSSFPVEITLGPVHINDSPCVIAIVRDTTSGQYIRKLEQKNKELRQFAYVASHDLQEPLRTISNFSEFLANNYADQIDENGKRSIHYINDATERMRSLVKGLLDYIRLGRDRELTTIDCNSLLEAVQLDLAAIISESGAKIKVAPLPQIRGYEIELRLLFQNLISNAIKFRKKNTIPEIKVFVKEDNGYTFAVQDNGIGIADNYQERIFTIFQRLHSKDEYEGTGIGLAHCQKIVEIHDGKIWVESLPNQGSTFYFNIPN
jgi:PAS domain S-box-containing protein